MTAAATTTTSITTTSPTRSAHRGSSRHAIAAAVLALGLLPLAATSAGAAQDAGPQITATTSSTHCQLSRVGTQFVRCDDLTGNGVPAPASIPSR